jgi:PAS domain S-box-containing protein
MLYTPQGLVHLMLNYQTVMSVDTGKPLEEGDYHALVDCQGQAYELMLLPHEVPFINQAEETPLQQLISHTVVNYAARAAVSRAVSSCTFSVSIADPTQPDMPLVAVSPAFEEMTGYSQAEVVGRNCRFLNHDCELNFKQRYELRNSCQTGTPFTGLLKNRCKSGDIFMNLLDLRGLRVAVDVETGEDIWYLVGIQSDVTDLLDDDGTCQEEFQEKHAKELQAFAEHIRQELQAEIAELAIKSRPGMRRSRSSENTVWEEGGTGGCVNVLPAAPGIQHGPKPAMQPMVVVLQEPAWIEPEEEDEASINEREDSTTASTKDTLSDDGQSPPCTQSEAKESKSSFAEAVSVSALSALPLKIQEASSFLERSKQYVPLAGALAVGMASVILFQRFVQSPRALSR